MSGALATLLALTIATQSAQPDPAVFDKFSKLELWESAERYKAKWKDAELRVTEKQLMLDVRTATTVRAIAMGYERPPEKETGMSAGAFAGWLAVAAAAGIIVGTFVLAPKVPPPSVVVVPQ